MASFDYKSFAKDFLAGGVSAAVSVHFFRFSG